MVGRSVNVKRPMTVRRSVVVAASPQAVYALVSDPRRTGDWSPENTGARFDAGVDALAVGDTFVGSNRRGPFRWVTRCTVVEAKVGESFAFHVLQIGVRTPRLARPIAAWAYRMRPVAGGTEVTEEWTDLRTTWSDPAARAFDFVVTGGSTFAEFNTRNIDVTLRRLGRALDSERPPPHQAAGGTAR